MNDASRPSPPESIGYAARRTATAQDRRKRERRANLIFIAIMVCLTFPALIITLVKFIKGEESKRPLAPPPMRNQWAYMDPAPPLQGIWRVTPPMVGSFVAAQAKRLVTLAPGMRSLVADGDFSPVMSNELSTQLVALGPQGGGYRLGLIGWHQKFAPIPELYTFTAHRTDGTTTIAEMNAYETVNMPVDVRDELQKYGFIIPPDGIVWIILNLPGTTPVSQLEIKYSGNGVSLDDTLTIAPDVIDPNAPSVTAPATRPATAAPSTGS